MKGQPSKYIKEQPERGFNGQAMGLGRSGINPVAFGSKKTPGLSTSPLQHPEVKPLILHLLLHAENLAHAVMPQPNPPGMEVRGLHKTGQTQFWGGLAPTGHYKGHWCPLRQQGQGRGGLQRSEQG